MSKRGIASVIERRVRDSLCANLDLIEEGLEVLEVEYRLPSRRGASGSVDILARDRTDMLVLIEVKANRKATREAVHEVAKYARLVAEAHGRGPSDVRCVIASTDWHELAHSFGEMRKDWDYGLEGYALKTDEQGTVIAAERIEPHARADTLYICPEQLIFLFQNRAELVAHADKLSVALTGLGATDHALLRMEYQGTNPAIVYPYCIYLALGATASQVSDTDQGDRPWTGFTEILRKLLNEVPSPTVERATSATMQTMDGWATLSTVRSGLFRNELAWGDAALLRRLRGEGVAVSSRLQATGRPRDRSRWKEIQRAALLVTQNNRAWIKALKMAFLASEADPQGLVDLYIFDPRDILLSLQSAQLKELSYVPLFRYTHTGDPKTSFQILGTIEWNGIELSGDWQFLLHAYGGTVESYLAHRVYGDSGAEVDRLLDRLGLTYASIIGRGEEWAQLDFDETGRPSFTARRPMKLLADLVDESPGLSLWLDVNISIAAPYPAPSAS